MILDTDIIPFTTDSYSIYKSDNEYFIVNQEEEFLMEYQELDKSCSTEENLEQWQDNYEQLEERFDIYYRENQASCHHFIGEFRVDSENKEPVVGSLYGFSYFTREDIFIVMSKLIRCRGLQNYKVKVATFYDLESIENIDSYTYQYFEYSKEELY
jgi:hypothetical protein